MPRPAAAVVEGRPGLALKRSEEVVAEVKEQQQHGELALRSRGPVANEAQRQQQELLSMAAFVMLAKVVVSCLPAEEAVWIRQGV